MSRRGAYEGSIYRRKGDGRWAASVHLGYADGRRVRKTYYGRSRAAVQQALNVAVSAYQSGLPVTRNDRQTLQAFVEQWLVGVRPSLRPSTHARYSQLMLVHVVPNLGRTPLTRLTPRQVQDLLNAKAASGLSPRTVGHIRAVLRRALNQAMRWNLVARNVASLVDPPHVPPFDIRPLNVAQARTFLLAAQSDRLAALYVVALASGMRQGELLALRWEDVDIDGLTLTVRRSLSRVGGKAVVVEPKSQRSRRTIPIPQLAVDALRRQRSRQAEDRLVAGAAWQDNGLVFTTALGTALDGSNVTHRFQRLLAEAGLPRQRFHDLRHACASFLLTQGVPARVVMETLGHSQVSHTLNIYTHVAPELQREAADRLEALLG